MSASLPICRKLTHRFPRSATTRDAAALIEDLYEALRDLRENISAASLVRNEYGKELREKADAALAKAVQQ